MRSSHAIGYSPESPEQGGPASLTGRCWVWPHTELKASDTRRQGAVSSWVLPFLESRGIVGNEVRTYLEPTLNNMPDPSLMADLDLAVERLCHAIDAGEPITVWGDYDVDGVCATTVLVDFLRRVAAPKQAHFYIPDRRQEGYGLNRSGIASIAQRGGLLITADSGITAVQEIAYANSLGLDVMIVDHHQLGPTLPAAHAILNPQRPDCAFPFKGLCAAGVAFMLIVGLRRALRARGHFLRRPEPDVRDLLDVTALATVADMVPIRGLNRILVAAGLRRMGNVSRVGLNALLAVCDVRPTAVSASDLGFRLGPRINARGRIGHAAAAVELLLTSDVKLANELAQSLDHANTERRRLEQDTAEAAKLWVSDNKLDAFAGIVVANATWHPGVLGLVASRLVSAFHRPAIVIGEGGKASARSVEGLDVLAAIGAGAALLQRFGGHRAAAGLTIDTQNIDAFRQEFAANVQAQLGPPPYIAALRPDLEVSPNALTFETAHEIESLGPYGQENPEPLLVTRSLEVQHGRLVGDNHLKLSLAGNLDAIGFRLGHLLASLPQSVDVAYRLERNCFRGKETLQLRIEDIRAARA